MNYTGNIDSSNAFQGQSKGPYILIHNNNNNKSTERDSTKGKLNAFCRKRGTSYLKVFSRRK